ncbi:MAG: hypothetical protein AAFX00_13455, partial [Pseudomonadota bacterium]
MPGYYDRPLIDVCATGDSTVNPFERYNSNSGYGGFKGGKHALTDTEGDSDAAAVSEKNCQRLMTALAHTTVGGDGAKAKAEATKIGDFRKLLHSSRLLGSASLG